MRKQVFRRCSCCTKYIFKANITYSSNKAGNKFSTINAPTAGSRENSDLPRGAADLQLYSLATPTGWKVGIILEELGIEYDAHVINIMNGNQFTSGFVSGVL